MNAKISIGITLFTLSLIATSFYTPPTLAQSDKVAFYCGRTKEGNNIYPATIVLTTTTGKEAGTLIIWRDKLGKMSPEQRCQSASQQFQKAWDSKDFNILKIGIDRQTGRGLICAVKDDQTPCDSAHMLYAVNNHEKAKEFKDRLLDSMKKAGNPQYQSSSDDSIDMKQLIDALSKPSS
jgi:hypothetical protein